MCIRDRQGVLDIDRLRQLRRSILTVTQELGWTEKGQIPMSCLLYTSDAADERSSVDLGGRRIIKKKKRTQEATHIVT